MDNLQFQLTTDDYVEAAKAHWRSGRIRYFFLFMGMVMVASIVLNVAMSRANLRSLLPQVAFACLFLGIPRIVPWGVRRSIKSQPTLCDALQISVAAEGLTFASERFNGHEKWAVYVAYLETPSLFLLYYGPRLYRVIPKRAFASTMRIDAFRAQMHEKVGRVRASWLP